MNARVCVCDVIRCVYDPDGFSTVLSLMGGYTHTHTCVHTLLFFSFSDTRFPSLCVKSRENIPPLRATIMCLFLCFVSSSGRRLLMTFDLCMVHFIFRVLLTLAPLPLNSLFFRFLPQYPSFFRFLSLFSCISYCSYFVFTQCCHNVSLFYIYIYILLSHIVLNLLHYY